MKLNEQQGFYELANNLWEQFFKNRVKEMLVNNVSYFKAEVKSTASGGKIGVQRPFDNTELHLPYAQSVSGVQVGDQVLVLVFGDMSNSFIIAKADLSTL